MIVLPTFHAQTINIDGSEDHMHTPSEWRGIIRIPGPFHDAISATTSGSYQSRSKARWHAHRRRGLSVEHSLPRAVKAVAGCHSLLLLASPARKTWQRLRVHAGKKPHERCHNAVVFMLLPNHSAFFRCKLVPIVVPSGERSGGTFRVHLRSSMARLLFGG